MSSPDDINDNDAANVPLPEGEPRSPGFQFQCDCCLEDCFGVPLIVNSKHEYVVDAECAAEAVVPRILESKANEYSYPASWGNVTIQYRHFLHLLPAGFRREYIKRQKEYQTPLADRIYCRKERRKDQDGLTEQCGRYLGARLKTPAGLRSGGTKLKACHDCDDRAFASCMRCGQILATNDLLAEGRNPHDCKKAADNDATAFDGLVQGVHYQVCPGCNIKVELAEACNALVCLGYACRTSFCAICGQPAAHDSDHWQEGKTCPRWNRPSDPNAGFDTGPGTLEHDAEPQERWDIGEMFWRNESNHWRRRTWNRTLVHDEVRIIRLLGEFNLAAINGMSAFSTSDLEDFITGVEHELFSQVADDKPYEEWAAMARTRAAGLIEESGFDLNITLARALLILTRDAIRLIPLFRGVGLQLTAHHVEHLSNLCAMKHGGISVVGKMIPKYVMRHHLGLFDVLQRTLQQLEMLGKELGQLLWVHGTAGNEPLPTDEDPGGLIAKYLEPYRDLVATRNAMARQGIPRPRNLDAALGMFWLQYSSLSVVRVYADAEPFDERYSLAVRVGVQHLQIQQQRRLVREIVWPAEFAEQKMDLWKRTMDAYDEAAARFIDIIEPDILDFDRGDFDP